MIAWMTVKNFMMIQKEKGYRVFRERINKMQELFYALVDI